MLKKEPIGASEDSEELSLWRMLRPLDANLLAKYYSLASPKEPNIDYLASQFKYWKKGNYHCFGMVHKETEKEHGIVRIVKPGDWISEQTYKHGRVHGLNRAVMKNEVQVFFTVEGEDLGFFCFNREFKETKRVDRHNKLHGLKASMFMPRLSIEDIPRISSQQGKD
jgi:hypothetical protein